LGRQKSSKHNVFMIGRRTVWRSLERATEAFHLYQIIAIHDTERREREM